MTKIQQVEAEYDEPFCDVVRGFAIMGYSRRFVASLLEINLKYFRELCVKFDLHRHFKLQKDMHESCKPKGKGWPKGTPRGPHYRYTEKDLLILVKKYPVVTLFDTLSGVSSSTVIRRFGSWNKAKKLSKGG